MVEWWDSHVLSATADCMHVRVSIAVIGHHEHKQLEEEEVYFSLQFHITVHHRRKSGQEIRAGTQR